MDKRIYFLLEYKLIALNDYDLHVIGSTGKRHGIWYYVHGYNYSMRTHHNQKAGLEWVEISATVSSKSTVQHKQTKEKERQERGRERRGIGSVHHPWVWKKQCEINRRQYHQRSHRCEREGKIPRTWDSRLVIILTACCKMVSLVWGLSLCEWTDTIRPSSLNASLMSRTRILHTHNNITATCNNNNNNKHDNDNNESPNRRLHISWLSCLCGSLEEMERAWRVKESWTEETWAIKKQVCGLVTCLELAAQGLWWRQQPAGGSWAL